MSAALAEAPEQLRDNAAAAAALAPPRERTRLERIVLQVGAILSLALLLGVGFAGYLFGLSGLSEQRAQTNLRKSFERSLGQAIAPIGPVSEGRPVAVLDIPRLGLHQAVIVEGTSSHDLANGPGHRADTVLPGQTGVSVVYGRRVSFGAPFEHLMRLQVGDRIAVTTGQGVATYRVSSFGDGDHPAPANSSNRLVLTTADSSGVPHSTVSVSADLISKPQPAGGPLPAVSEDQKGLASGVDGGLLTTLLWSQALAVLAVVATIAAHRWSVTATWLAAAPLALAVIWNLYENLACLLPNLY